MNIICVSGKAQHGKDTSAEIFKELLEASGKKVLLTHYADLLKWMCKNYFGWNGEKDAYGRTLLQKVGTDIVRSKDPEFWVNWVIKLLELFDNEWEYIIIPDCRFPNEINALRSKFGDKHKVLHFRVIRPNFDSNLSLEQKQHISETALDSYPYDARIENIDLDDLRLKIQSIIDENF